VGIAGLITIVSEHGSYEVSGALPVVEVAGELQLVDAPA